MTVDTAKRKKTWESEEKEMGSREKDKGVQRVRPWEEGMERWRTYTH